MRNTMKFFLEMYGDQRLLVPVFLPVVPVKGVSFRSVSWNLKLGLFSHSKVPGNPESTAVSHFQKLELRWVLGSQTS
jgi:hypothetical protein